MIKNKTRRTKQTAQRKLLRAAADAFAAQGFDAASIRAIADRAGVNIALIAYHFGGKDGLYEAVLEDWVGPLLETVDRELAGLHGAGKRTDALVTAFLRHALIVAPGVAALVARESIMAGSTATTKRTANTLRPLVERLDAVLPACDTTVTQGTEFLALLLRLAAPMPSIDGDGAKNYHRARLRALSILRQGGGHGHHHAQSSHKSDDTPRRHSAASSQEPAHAESEPREHRVRHGHPPEHEEESQQTGRQNPRMRHAPVDADMDFVD
jgi:AcrR family transcriptional regulator